MKKRILLTLALVLTLLMGTLALVIGVSANSENPALEINGANVSFEGSVHLIYSVGYDKIASPENIKLLVWREAEGIHADNLKKGTEKYVLSKMTNPPDNLPANSVAFEFSKIAAAEMTENVYARAYYVEDGEEIYSPVRKYSVLQYALNKLGITGTASETATLKEMLANMLLYGASAQKHYEVNLDRLATDTYVKIKLYGVTFAVGPNTGLFVKGTDNITVTSTLETTAELPYIVWTDAAGKIIGSGATVKVKPDSNKTVNATLSSENTSFGAYERVVVVGLDGAGGSLLKNANTPNIDRIFADGAVTYNMLTIPTCSAHAWTSFFHGVLTEDHGIRSNLQVETTPYPQDSKYPSFLRVIREANPDAKLASIATWTGINVGIVEDGFDIYKYRNGDINGTAEAVKYINENNDLEMLYVHLNDPDSTGHAYGYGNEQYNDVLSERTDVQIGQIYQALADNNMLEDTLFIVTTDHGGVPNADGSGTHGGLGEQESRVFFGAVGKTVEKGLEKIEDMEIRDCAGIVLYALGYQQPASYTARVPGGLFDGVSATARPTYYDTDNHRDIEASGETPEKGSDNYIDNFIDNPLYVYMPFDGDTEDMYGNGTTEVDNVKYTDGYFGGAANLDDGYVKLFNVAPGTSSFTISMWIKAPLTYRRSPVLSSKLWAGGNYKDSGFVLLMDGDSTPSETSIWNIGYGGTMESTLVSPLPEDYNRGWMHLTLIVDREAKELRMAYDFGEVYTTAIPDSFDGVDLYSSQYHLTIGNTPNGSAPTTMSLTVDEFMMFEGAFNTNDINSLAAYFGKDEKHEEFEETVSDRYHENAPTPAPDSEKHLSNYASDLFGSLEYYLPFDNGLQNAANNTNTAVAVGNVTFASQGYFGDALRMRTTTDYVQLPDLKLGKDSFSVGMWVNIDTLPTSTMPILSSQDIVTSSASAGFTLYLSNKGTLNFVLSDGSNRTYDSVSLPNDHKTGWMYIMFVIDREAKTWGISYDFGDFKTGSIAGYENIIADIDGRTWTIANDGTGKYWGKLTPMIDEFMIFGEAVSSADLANLKDYFDQKEFPKTPAEGTNEHISNFVDKDPVIYLPFDNTVANVGTGSPVNTVGTTTYNNRGVFGQALLFANDKTAIKAPEVKLGTADFSFALWIDVNSLSGSTIPIVSTQHGEGGVSLGKTQGFTLAIGTSSGSKYLEFYFGNESSSGKIVTALPNTVEDLGWMHLAVVIDRGNTTTYTLYVNFEIMESRALQYSGGAYVPASWSADGRDTASFTVGESGSGAYWNNLNAYIDEFMLFDYALAQHKFNEFAEYYGKEPVPSISDFVGFDPTLQLDFNGGVVNKGSSSASFGDTNMNYVDSPFGTAGDFTSVDHGKTTPEHWANSSDFALSTEKEGGGYTDITVSMWLALQTDMILDDYAGTQWKYGDRILFATHDYSSEKTVPGMSLFMYNKPVKVALTDLLNVSYMNAEDYVADDAGYAMYASGEHAGEYVYRQLLRLRTSAAAPDGTIKTWDGAMVYIYAPLGGWTNLVIVIDRGQFGVNDGTVKFYQDGHLLEYYKPEIGVYELEDTMEDYGSLAGSGLYINDDVGHYPRDMESYLDEFVVFDRALTEEDLANLAAYYDAIRDAE